MQRPRPRKPRLSRMDAAVDAMAQLGFPGRLVRKCVNQLLKEYGGHEAWPFIEEYSYKELIEAILRDNEENKQARLIEGGHQSKLITDSKNTLEEIQTDNEPQQIEADPQVVKTPTLPQINCSSSPSPPIKRKTHPLNGWIVSDEEDSPENGVHETVDVTKKIEADGEVKGSNTPHGNETPSPSPILNNKQPLKTRSVPCYGWIEEEEEEEEEEGECPNNPACKNADDTKEIEEEPGHEAKSSMMIPHSISISISSSSSSALTVVEKQPMSIYFPLPILKKQRSKRMRFPCYGWIDNDDDVDDDDDDDDDDDGPIEFAYSKPARGWFSAEPVGEGNERRCKNSRWDQSIID